MSINTQPYPIYVTSAWGMSPRMVADDFAAEHFGETCKVAAFDPDGTFRLVDRTRTYRVVMQPGVAGVSKATYGVLEEPQPMWMTAYIRAIKCQFRDTYGFVPTGGTADDPTFASIPDGKYPMTIDGKLDRVAIVDGKISCCNFDEKEPAR